MITRHILTHVDKDLRRKVADRLKEYIVSELDLPEYHCLLCYPGKSLHRKRVGAVGITMELDHFINMHFLKGKKFQAVNEKELVSLLNSRK